jgi:hypothetical protein
MPPTRSASRTADLWSPFGGPFERWLPHFAARAGWPASGSPGPCTCGYARHPAMPSGSADVREHLRSCITHVCNGGAPKLACADTQGVLCSPPKSMQGVPAVKQFWNSSELLAV